MKIIFYFFLLLFFLTSCAANKVTYLCGDAPCANKKEKEEYFKKTMTVESIEDKNNLNKNISVFEKIKKKKIKK